MAQETGSLPALEDIGPIAEKATQDFKRSIASGPIDREIAQASEQINNPFQYNLAADAPIDPNTAEIQAAEIAARPEYVQGSIGAPVDTEATVRALKEGLQAAGIPEATVTEQPQQATPSEFAVPEIQQVPQQAQMSEVKNPYEDIYRKQQQANSAVAKATIDKSNAELEANKFMQDKVAEQELKLQESKAKFESDWSSKARAMDDITKQLQGQDFTAPKIDAGRFWNSRTTGDKVLAGLAIALGAWGQGLTGAKSNVALDMINQAIDRDVDEQKQNVATEMQGKQQKAQNLRDQISSQNTVMDNLRQKFGNDLSAETAFRLLATQQTQAKLNALTSKFNAQVAPEQAKVLNAQLDMQKQQLTQQLKAQQAQQYMMQSALSGKNGAVSELQMAAAGVPKEVIAQVKEVRERSMPADSGWQGMANTKENAQKFAEKTLEVTPAIASIDRINAITKDFNKITDLEKRAQLTTEVAVLVGALRLPITGPGILTDSEREMLSNIIGDPTQITSLPSLQKMKMQQIRKKLESDLVQTGKAYGFRKVNSDVKNLVKPYQK